MNQKRIEELLSKYYEGVSSLTEEQELKAFFEQSDVPEHLKAEQIQFNFYEAARQEKSSRTFEPDEHVTKSVQLKPYVRTAWSMAASVVLVIGIYLFMQKADEPVNEYENPEIAYAETKKALLLISEKLNKGSRELDKLSKLNQTKVLLSNEK